MNKLNKEAHRAQPAGGKRTAADLLGSNAEIARLLGEHYKQLLSLETPDRFAKLLDRLAETELTDQETAQSKAEG